MKNKHLLPILLIICLNSFPALAQWANMGSGVTASNHKVWGLSVANPNVVWGVSYDYVNFTWPDYLVKTSDGGATWTAIPIDEVPEGLYSIQLFVLDEMTGWLATADELNPISGKVFKTTDGGETWVEQSSGFTGFNETPAAIHFWNANEGVAFGATCYQNYNEQIAIYTTDDGGDTWTKVSGEAMPTQLPGEGMCIYSGNGFYEAVGDNIWFLSSKNRVFRSIDRGRNWEAYGNVISGSGDLASLAFKDELNGIAVAAFPNKAARTTDGGLTWAPIGIPTTTRTAQIEYIPGTEGTYLAHNAAISWVTTNTKMLVTYDDGESWETFTANVNLDCIEFFSPTVGFAGGKVNSSNFGGMYQWNGFSLDGAIHVNDDAVGANDGTSWKNAFTSLQDALAIARDGDKIWVAEGTYQPDGPNGDRTASFLLDKKLKLYGGFAGTERNLEERGNPADFPTILSGDLNEDDVEDNFTANREDNSMTVLTVNGNITGEAMIDGFTIQNGHAGGSGSTTADNNGGGVLCSGAPIITRCHFIANYAVSSGGGLYLSGNSSNGAKVEHCFFEKNRADEALDAGAGLYVGGATGEGISIDQCEFRSNEGGRGSGVCAFNSNLKVTNSLFLNNFNIRQGGGLWFYANAVNGLSLIVEDCLFEGNRSSFGGGLYSIVTSDDCSIDISGTKFEENITSPNSLGWGQGGSGMCVFGQGSELAISIDSCLFRGNSTTGNSSALGIWFEGPGQSLSLTNAIFTENENTGFYATASIWSWQGSSGQAVVENCTFEKNASTHTPGLDIGSGTLAGAIHFDVRGCSFLDNHASAYGGGLALWGDIGSSPSFTIEDCRVEGNTAGERAGGIWVLTSSSNFHATVNRCNILNNQSPWGSAVGAFRTDLVNYSIPEGATFSLENSLVAENSGEAAAIALDTFPGFQLLSTTVARNQANGLLLQGQSGLTLQNTILYNPGFMELEALTEDATVSSNSGNLIGDSSLEGWLHPANDQPATNPLLEHDYRLGQNSPAVDAGIAYEDMPDLDLAGHNRMQGSCLDIGAFESPFDSGNACLVSAREALAEAPLSLSPNPAASFLKVDLPVSTPQAFQLQLLDAQGKRVRQLTIRNGELLDVKALPQGLYWVKTVVGRVVYTGRFVKQ